MSTIKHTRELSIQNLTQLDVQIDPDEKTVWLYMNPRPRPCFNFEILRELREYQRVLEHYEGKLPIDGQLVEIDYQILTSNDPTVFNLGGDLELFSKCILRNDAETLRSYARACIDVLHPNILGYHQDVTTISLVTGDALGGGFEAALSSHILIVEKGAQLGLPEILFNLFPGMGAYQLLSRRLSPSQAQKMILSGRLYSAEELYEMGIVDVLAERGEGMSAVHSYRRSHSKRRNGYSGVQTIQNAINPISYDELMKVCEIWVESALKIDERDLRTMARLVRSQNRLQPEAADAIQKRESA